MARAKFRGVIACRCHLLIICTLFINKCDFSPLCQLPDGVAALFHEPAGGGGGSADADALDAFEPGGFDLVNILDEVGVGIDAQTLVVEHLAVGTLTPADEEDEVVAGGELRDVRHTLVVSVFRKLVKCRILAKSSL